jgi:hypothetical protein
MFNTPIDVAQMWMTVQEPRVTSSAPNSYLLLLSALDNGWRPDKVELSPSWDQHGLVYLVTLSLYNTDHTQQLILPRNPLVDNLLEEYLEEPLSR